MNTVVSQRWYYVQRVNEDRGVIEYLTRSTGGTLLWAHNIAPLLERDPNDLMRILDRSRIVREGDPIGIGFFLGTPPSPPWVQDFTRIGDFFVKAPPEVAAKLSTLTAEKGPPPDPNAPGARADSPLAVCQVCGGTKSRLILLGAGMPDACECLQGE